MNIEPAVEVRRMPPLLKTAAVKGIKSATLHHLSRGIDVDIRDESGRTALILAAAKGHFEICSILLENGADPSCCDNEGVNAIIAAEKSNYHSVADLLRKYLPREPIQKAAPVDYLGDSFDSAVPSLNDSESVLSEWIEDVESEAPESDVSCFSDAKSISLELSNHNPIDLDEEWADVDVNLPELFGNRRQKTIEEESSWLEAVRKLFLFGICNLVITESDICDVLSIIRDDSEKEEFEQRLRLSLEEFGIQVEGSDYAIHLSSAEAPEEDQEDVAESGVTYLALQT